MAEDAAAPDKPLPELDTTVSHSARIWNYWHEVAQRVAPELVAALAPGSFLAINHSTSAVSGEAMEEAVRHWNQVGTPSMTLRTPEQIAHFFDGLELLPPGVVSCSRWRPIPGQLPGAPAEVDEFCGIGRKA